MTNDKIKQAKELLEKEGYIIQEPKVKTIIINNVEYELKQHDNGKMLSEIKIPKGKRLLLPSEAMMLYERGWIDSSFWFFVEQTNKEEEKKGNVARFYAVVGGADLDCSGNPSNWSVNLGVIFAKDLLTKQEIKRK